MALQYKTKPLHFPLLRVGVGGLVVLALHVPVTFCTFNHDRKF